MYGKTFLALGIICLILYLFMYTMLLAGVGAVLSIPMMITGFGTGIFIVLGIVFLVIKR